MKLLVLVITLLLLSSSQAFASMQRLAQISSIKTDLNLCLYEENTLGVENFCELAISDAYEAGLSDDEIRDSLRGNFNGMKILAEISANKRPPLEEGQSLTDIIDEEVEKLLD